MVPNGAEKEDKRKKGSQKKETSKQSLLWCKKPHPIEGRNLNWEPVRGEGRGSLIEEGGGGGSLASVQLLEGRRNTDNGFKGERGGKERVYPDRQKQRGGGTLRCHCLESQR